GSWPDEWRDLVFVTETGTPIDPSNLRRLTARVAARAGVVARLRPYELRHTATSLLADQGATNEQLADLLGHASTRTLDVTYRPPLSASELPAAGLAGLFPVPAGTHRQTTNGPA